ncbi:Lipolytic enzyme [Mycena kentingensis (nom. inval.)]|nr:Lipolytic enzyme [Mycena kentingensis (nom. inval.)]
MPRLRCILASLLASLVPASNAAGFSGQRLRIMPLGASITFGVASTNGNGYREPLYNLLIADGNEVQMVGSQVNGTMESPWSEGYPGFVIKQVLDKSNAAMPVQNPNIVTILVGTNDMLQDADVGNAPARLTTLIQSVLDAPAMTLVVVSTIPPTANAATNARVNAYNAAIPGVVDKFIAAGRSVVFVDCHAAVPVGDLADGVHPVDAGYERMGRVFYDGIQAAFAKGWVFAVQGADPIDGSTGNGYRQQLLSLLTADGNTVDMVGSQSSGNMSDPWHEGYPNLTLAQLNDHATTQTALRLPNIVLIHAGTVDMLNNDDPAGAPARLRTLIKTVLDAPQLTLVVVSTLIPAGDAAANTRIDTFNRALPALVADFVKAGKSVVLVDGHDVVAGTDLVDGVNPGDAAYARLARVYYNGLQIAEGKGWIWDVQGSAPADGDGSSGSSGGSDSSGGSAPTDGTQEGRARPNLDFQFAAGIMGLAWVAGLVLCG